MKRVLAVLVLVVTMLTGLTEITGCKSETETPAVKKVKKTKPKATKPAATKEKDANAPAGGGTEKDE